jgi:predicted transcriptional regulator
MKLTDNELEVMIILWRNGNAMTAAEVVEASTGRKWKEKSIFYMMSALIRKKAAVLAHLKPTVTNTARAYAPTLTSDQYMVLSIDNAIQERIDVGLPVDIRAIIEHLKTREG